MLSTLKFNDRKQFYSYSVIHVLVLFRPDLYGEQLVLKIVVLGGCQRRPAQEDQWQHKGNTKATQEVSDRWVVKIDESVFTQRGITHSLLYFRL